MPSGGSRTYVTDLIHFEGVLAPGSGAPAPARKMAKFFHEVVAIASREPDNGRIETDVRCFRRFQRGRCPGFIVAARRRGEEQIDWVCSSCGDGGSIRNWQGSSVDLSRFARLPRGVPEVDVRGERTPTATAQGELLGRWRITGMELWSAEAFDLLGAAFFRFDQYGGEFQFIAVRGGLDCHYSERDGRATVDFSWEGEDDGEPRCGRGWAILESKRNLRGKIYFHLGDESEFDAKK